MPGSTADGRGSNLCPKTLFSLVWEKLSEEATIGAQDFKNIPPTPPPPPAAAAVRVKLYSLSNALFLLLLQWKQPDGEETGIFASVAGVV